MRVWNTFERMTTDDYRAVRPETIGDEQVAQAHDAAGSHELAALYRLTPREALTMLIGFWGSDRAAALSELQAIRRRRIE